MDDGYQDDAPDDCFADTTNKRRHGKSGKPNRQQKALQMARYRRKYPHKYRDYMRRYMANRRKMA